MSDEFEWAKIAASLLGGGLAGAAMTVGVTSFRGRIQPIGKRVEVTPLFTSSFIGSTLRPTIIVSAGEIKREFANLHMAEVTIVNRGNRDFASFKFGLTLDPADSCVHTESTSPDRHHEVRPVSDVTPGTPSSAFDFVLHPLNRKDVYIFKLFIVAGNEKPAVIRVGSAEAVRFIEMPSMAEVVAGIAAEVVIKPGLFGFLQIR